MSKKWFFSDFSNWFQTPFDCLIWVTDNNIRTDSWLLSEWERERERERERGGEREREKKSKRVRERESKRSLNLKGLTPFQHELRHKNYNRSHFSLFLNHRMTIFQTFLPFMKPFDSLDSNQRLIYPTLCQHNPGDKVIIEKNYGKTLKMKK